MQMAEESAASFQTLQPAAVEIHSRGNSCTSGCSPSYCFSKVPLKATNCATTLWSSRGIVLCIKTTQHMNEVPAASSDLNVFLYTGPWEVLSAERPVSHSALLSHGYRAPGGITVHSLWKWKAHGGCCVLLSLLVPSTGSDFPLRGGDGSSQRLQSGAVTSLHWAEPRMSNNHHHEFLGKSARMSDRWLTEWLFLFFL